MIIAGVKCFLCGRALPVKVDRNGKLYLVCVHCKVQTFIRAQPGLDLLKSKAFAFELPDSVEEDKGVEHDNSTLSVCG